MVLSSSCLAAVWLDDGRRNVAQSMVSTEVVVGDERVGPWGRLPLFWPAEFQVC